METTKVTHVQTFQETNTEIIDKEGTDKHNQVRMCYKSISIPTIIGNNTSPSQAILRKIVGL